MKTFTSALILTLISITFLSANVPNKLATCTGASPCKACKNCKYCKHCNQGKGTCGICKK